MSVRVIRYLQLDVLVSGLIDQHEFDFLLLAVLVVGVNQILCGGLLHIPLEFNRLLALFKLDLPYIAGLLGILHRLNLDNAVEGVGGRQGSGLQRRINGGLRSRFAGGLQGRINDGLQRRLDRGFERRFDGGLHGRLDGGLHGRRGGQLRSRFGGEHCAAQGIRRR